MKKVYKSALGRAIDMDSLRLFNEETIAVGNMRVNARGDELGPGGEILRTRNEVMADYYKLNTPVIAKSVRAEVDEEVVMKPVRDSAAEPPVRGSLANSVLKQPPPPPIPSKILDDPEGNE